MTVLTQVSISPGGMPKLAVLTARVTRDGVAGDWQKNRKYHGGPIRAVCLYSEELYAWLNGQGVKVSAGQLGENLTTRGLDLLSLSPGQRLRVGGCTIELTETRVPCRQLNRWHPELLELMRGRSGWLAKVVSEGDVKPGDAIEFVSRPDPRNP